MTKKLIKFQFDVIFNNKQLIMRVCLILSIAIILALLTSWGLGSTSSYQSTDDEWIELLKEDAKSTYKDIMEQESHQNYEGFSWYNEQESKYYDKSAIAEYEYYLATDTYPQYYYDLDSSFESYFKEFNPASRIMIWAFLSTMMLFAFAGLFPLAYTNKKGKYKNLMILGNSAKDIAISEIVVQYVSLFALWLLFAIVGNFLGIGSHKIMTIQYNNGNALAAPVYSIYVLKEIFALIVSMFILSFGIGMNSVIKNKLITSIISISLILVPLFTFMEMGSFGLSASDIGVIYFPIINLVMDDWLIGNYKLIWISAIYLLLSAVLIYAKIYIEKNKGIES